jgi:hypothetical protein
MTVRTLPTQTENFTYQYLDSIFHRVLNVPLVEAQARANALLATSESDFAQLKRWFGVKDGSGSGNRITVRLKLDSWPTTTDTSPTARCSSRSTLWRTVPLTRRLPTTARGPSSSPRQSTR